MIILKFGGSSVGTPDRIENVIKILKSYKSTKIAVVFSAFQTVTDNLIKLGDLSKSGDEEYLSLLDEVKQKHINTVSALIVKSKRKRSLNYVENLFNDLTPLRRTTLLKTAHLEPKNNISENVPIADIASVGTCQMEHFSEVFEGTKVEIIFIFILLATIFSFVILIFDS